MNIKTSRIRKAALQNRMVFEGIGNRYFAGDPIEEICKRYGEAANQLFSPEIFLDRQKWASFLSIGKAGDTYLYALRVADIASKGKEIRAVLETPRDKVMESYSLNGVTSLILENLGALFALSRGDPSLPHPVARSSIAALAGIHHIWQQKERVFGKKEGMGLLGDFMTLFLGICPPYIFTQREWEEYGGGEAMAMSMPLSDGDYPDDVFERVFALPLSPRYSFEPGMVDQWTVLESYYRAKPIRPHLKKEDLRNVFRIRRIRVSPSLELRDDILIDQKFSLLDSDMDMRPLDVLADDLWDYALDMTNTTNSDIFKTTAILMDAIDLFKDLSYKALTTQAVYKVGTTCHRRSLFEILLDIANSIPEYLQQNRVQYGVSLFNKNSLETLRKEGGYKFLSLIQGKPELIHILETFLSKDAHLRNFSFLFPEAAKYLMTLEASRASGISPDEYCDETLIR